MVSVIFYGWFTYDQDPSYSRLNKVYDKSVSIKGAQEALDYAKAAVSADPVQDRITVELEKLESGKVPLNGLILDNLLLPRRFL